MSANRPGERQTQLSGRVSLCPLFNWYLGFASPRRKRGACAAALGLLLCCALCQRRSPGAASRASPA